MPEYLNIITDPNPILRNKSRDITPEEIKKEKFKRLCGAMTDTMFKSDGVGLAAPQIGKNLRLTIINTKDGPVTVINPKLIKKSWAKEWGEEGCLSVPNVFSKVKRHKTVTCSFLDADNNEQVIKASGLLARIFQHEIDHLDGVLFIDKTKKLKENKDHVTGNLDKIKNN